MIMKKLGFVHDERGGKNESCGLSSERVFECF